MSAALRGRALAARDWLFGGVLPYWQSHSFDHKARCFHEGFDAKGAPLDAPRRIRTQARLTFAFARGGALGWDGPWRAAAEAGASVLLERGLRADGGTNHALGPDGSVTDTRRDLYDVSCVLLGLAEASRALNRPDLLASAQDLFTWCQRDWARPNGGYAEGEIIDAGVRRQNPHMHLLEAFLVLFEAGAGAVYLEHAEQLASLMADKLMADGALREYFDDAWTPLAGERGRIAEPGHEFEWVWLLNRLAALGGDDLSMAGDALLAHAETHGVERGVVFDEISGDGGPLLRSSRLWPHAERLKAHLVRFEQSGNAHSAECAVEALDTLMSYRNPAIQGLWYDRRGADGVWLDETAAPSSLYHIITAFTELFRVAGVNDGSGASR